MKTSSSKLWFACAVLLLLVSLSACASPTQEVTKLRCPINPKESGNTACRPWVLGEVYDITTEVIVDMYNNAQNTFGIWKKPVGVTNGDIGYEYVLIETVGYYPAPSTAVIAYPTKTLIFSTTSNPANCQPDQTTFGLCANTIGGLSLAGGVKASLNLNGEMHLLRTQVALELLYKAGSINALGSSLQLALNSHRNVLENVLVKDATTQAGTDAAKAAFQNILDNWSYAPAVSWTDFQVRELKPDGYDDVSAALLETYKQEQQIQAQSAVVSAQATLQAQTLEVQVAKDNYARQKIISDTVTAAKADSSYCAELIAVDPKVDCSAALWVRVQGGAYKLVPVGVGNFQVPYNLNQVAASEQVTNTVP